MLKSGGAESTFLMKWLGRQARVVNARQRFAVPSQVLNAVPRLLDHDQHYGDLGAWRIASDRRCDLDRNALCVRAADAALHRAVYHLRRVGRGRAGDGWRRAAHRGRPALPARSAACDAAGRTSALDRRARAASGLVWLQQTRSRRSYATSPSSSRRAGASRSSAYPAAGKSTVAKLVSGLFAPWSGKVLFDGVEREAIDPALLATRGRVRRSRDLALSGDGAQQSHALGPRGFRCGDRARRPRRLHPRRHRRQAARATKARWPRAASTSAAANGSGWRSHARWCAIPALVVLDEATSALDPLTEHLIDESLRRRGCACLIVAHRLSTIRDADEIHRSRERNDRRARHARRTRRAQGPLSLAGEIAIMSAEEIRIAGDEILVLATPAHGLSRALPARRSLFVVELDARGTARPDGDRFWARRVRRRRYRYVVRRRTATTLALIAVGVVPTILEPWDLARERTGAGRDEALRRYFAMLVGGDSIEVDLHSAPSRSAAGCPRTRSGRARALVAPSDVRSHASGTGWLLDSHRCDAETGIVPIGGAAHAARTGHRAHRALRRRPALMPR